MKDARPSRLSRHSSRGRAHRGASAVPSASAGRPPDGLAGRCPPSGTGSPSRGAQTAAARAAAARASTGRTARRTGASRRPSSAAGSPSRSTTPSPSARPSRSPSTGRAAPARQGERQGSLVYNPGGPGGSGLRFPQRIATKNAACGPRPPRRTTSSASTRAASATPRRSPAWTRRSSSRRPRPTRCPTTRPTSAPSASWPRSTRTAARSAAAPMLAQMTTPNTARDLDVIRAALGDKKLNFLGVSYGTYLGAVYADALPDPRPPDDRRQRGRPLAEEDLVQDNLDQDVAFETPLARTGRSGSPSTTTSTTSAAPRQGPGEVGASCVPPPRRTRSAASSARPSCSASSRARPTTTPPGPPSPRCGRPTSAGDTQALVDAAGPDLSDTAGNKRRGEQQRGLHRRRVHRRRSGPATGGPGTGTTPGCTRSTPSSPGPTPG